MKQVSLILYLVTLSLCISCSNSETKEERLTLGSREKKVELTDSITFKLDELGIQNSEYLQYLIFDGKEYLATYNGPDNSIKIYSFSSGDLYSSTPLYTDGPNAILGIVGSPHNFLIESWDSIYIVSSKQQKIFLINQIGEIQSKREIITFQQDPRYSIFADRTLCPILSTESDFMLTGSIPFNTDALPLVAVIPKDINQQQKQVPTDFPLYSQYNYSEIGNANFFLASSTIDENDRILVSYPMDHRIMVLDKDFKTNYVELPNPKLGVLKTFGNGKKNTQKYYDFQGTAPVYHAIFADSYRKLIYRIARLPFPMDELRLLQNGGKPKTWDFSIMIYDYDFNLLGEKTLINTLEYDMNSIFISRKGINIRKESKDEDKMIFHTFEILDL